MNSEQSQHEELGYRPDLPDFGIYNLWPTPGTDWIHPDDVALVESLIPSSRVFERIRYEPPYYVLRYGDQSFRVKPAMWMRIAPTELQVGEQIEMLSCFGKYEPGIARIREITFNTQTHQYEYFLRKNDIDLPQPFAREQIRQLHERFELHESYTNHPKPKCVPTSSADLLDVGAIGDDELGPN